MHVVRGFVPTDKSFVSRSRRHSQCAIIHTNRKRGSSGQHNRSQQPRALGGPATFAARPTAVFRPCVPALTCMWYLRTAVCIQCACVRKTCRCSQTKLIFVLKFQVLCEQADRSTARTNIEFYFKCLRIFQHRHYVLSFE